MLSFQLDFEIYDGHINTFLIGSKSLFEKIEIIVQLLAKSIDVEVEITHKLIELESSDISYKLMIDIKYPVQLVFGSNITGTQIDEWFRQGLSLILNKKNEEDSIHSLSLLAKETGLELYFIYVAIPENILKELLGDFEKLSILLFKKLVFLEKQG